MYTEGILMVYCLSFLNHDSYQTYNRNIAKKLKSVTAAIMLSELVNRYEYHANRDELVEKDDLNWFYFTAEKCEERTCLSRREQDTGIKILEAYDFIQKKSIGLPAKRHFRLREDKILEALSLSRKDSSLAENAKQHSTKTPNFSYIEEPKQDVVGERALPCKTRKKDMDLKMITKDDVYHYSLTARTDWKPAEIESAWLAFQGATTPITDPYAYIAGIINKKRVLGTQKRNKCQQEQKPSDAMDSAHTKTKSENIKKKPSVAVSSEQILGRFGSQKKTSSK
jgi:hypothetical protein